MANNDLPLVKTSEAARALGISATWLYRHRAKIVGSHRAGRMLRWDIEAIRKWMRQEASHLYERHNG